MYSETRSYGAVSSVAVEVSCSACLYCTSLISDEISHLKVEHVICRQHASAQFLPVLVRISALVYRQL